MRVLLRDLSGKSCWDASILYRTPETIGRDDYQIEPLQERGTVEMDNGLQMESLMVGTPLHNLPQRAMRHRPPNVLPEVSNAAQDLDQLDDVSILTHLVTI